MEDDDKKNVKFTEEKVQKLMRDLSVLKNALLKEQSTRKEYEDKLRDKEIELRQKTEQIESLEFNNSRLTKRVESLMEEIGKKTEGKPSFIGNLLSGKHKDELEKLQKSLSIIGEDLQAKIEENEKLHIRMFEFKEEQRGKIESLETKLKEYLKLNEDQDKLIGKLRENEGHLTHDLEELDAKKKTLEKDLNDRIKQLAYQEFTFRQEKEKLSTKVREYSDLVRKRLPFDEYKNPALNGLNMPKPKRSEATQSELLQKVMTSGELGLQKFEELIGGIVGKLVLISTYAEAEDQKDYNAHSKKIREEIPEYTEKWKGFIKDVLETLDLFTKLDMKNFKKNGYALIESAMDIEEKCKKIVSQFPAVVLVLENIEKLLKNLFCEEITLVQDIGFVKEKNEAILTEFKEMRGHIVHLFETIRELMSFNARETCSNSEKKATLWLKAAEDFRKISKRIENIVALYKEKLTKEDEGLEKRPDEDGDTRKIIYLFREQIPLNKFRNINNDISNFLQSFATHTHSAILCFAEYLEKEFEFVSQENGTAYPVNFMSSGYLGKIGLTQALNDHMKSQPKGIPYQEALENKKALTILQEKEVFYCEQISSLKSALQQAESQMDTMIDEDEVSETSTIKLNERERDSEASVELAQATKVVLLLREKYEEICKRLGEEPQYTNEGVNLETIERFSKVNQPLEKKESDKKSLVASKNELFENNDVDSLSENVAKGLQRVSMRYMNNNLKLVPLNSLMQADENGSERTRILFEKARDKILGLALKNEHLEQDHGDFNVQFEAVKEVVNAEKSLREQAEKNCKDMEKNVAKLKADMESIKSNYDAQIKMLSEHIISLSEKK